MNEINVNSVLAQIRSLGAQAANRPQMSPGALGSPGATAVNGGFQQFLSGAVNKVNETQAQSASLKRAFELGDPNADLAQVMVAQARAQVSFKATVEIRNRLVSAYQDIMNMPI